MIHSLGDRQPQIAPGCFVAPGAHLIGDVALEAQVSVWFGAVVRADNAPIFVGAGSNIQDGAVLHVDPGIPLSVGERVSVGHQAMLHGCTIGNGSLIGIGAVVLNGARIGENCLIGAKSLVTENTVVPDGSLFLGSPGKVVRTMSEEQITHMQAGAQLYVDKIALYAALNAIPG